jgi:type II secretory pathway pseudopilin PulG
MKTNKKGDIWISAVLYIALGIIILSLVLAVGIPTIQKMRDNQLAKQTKEIMFVIDNNVRSVFNQGPGAQTQLKVEIGRGDLDINTALNEISWTTRTKAILSEPGFPVNEGNLQILTEDSPQKGEYDLTLTLAYTQITLDYSGINPIKGTHLLSISNTGGGVVKITQL